jgi:D-lactate dehydrogenase
MHVAVFSTRPYDRTFLDRANAPYGYTFSYFETALHRETASLAQDCEAVCVFVNDQLDAPTLTKLARSGVRLVALRCAGFNNVDLTAAAAQGIGVVRVPAYAPEAVAEHAVALILTLNRKTHKAFNRVRENNFSLNNLTGFNLHGKTVGVVGTGKIGTAFCRIMRGFGCRVLAHDPFPAEAVRALGIEYVSFDELLPQADIIALHCPLTPESRYLFDAPAFARMKPGAMLINTSRGALINTTDAIEALKTGQLGYLGLDVYEQEEALFFRDLSGTILHDDVLARLMTFPNVLITAHQGFFTEEALTQIAETTLRNLAQFARHEPLSNQVPLP